MNFTIVRCRMLVYTNDKDQIMKSNEPIKFLWRICCEQKLNVAFLLIRYLHFDTAERDIVISNNNNNGDDILTEEHQALSLWFMK